MDIFKQIGEARARQKRLKKGETKFLALTDALTEWLADNSDLFDPALLHAACARLESAFTGIERLMVSADGVWDPEDVRQSREDLEQLRRTLEAKI